MTTPTNTATAAAPDIGGQTVPIRANYSAITKLGHWTEARRFDIKATRGTVLLDLRSNGIEAGDIGSGKVKDWTGAGVPGERTIHLLGEIRKAEVRVHRGGVAIVSAMLTREYLADLRRAFREARITSIDDIRRAYREGRWTTVEDPGRVT